jgi:hypothetical protein
MELSFFGSKPARIRHVSTAVFGDEPRSPLSQPSHHHMRLYYPNPSINPSVGILQQGVMGIAMSHLHRTCTARDPLAWHSTRLNETRRPTTLSGADVCVCVSCVEGLYGVVEK